MKKLFTFLVMSIFTVLAANAQDTYVVAGMESMMGSHWDAKDANNQMTTTDNTTYTLVKEGVKLEAGINYEYKIVKNGSEWFPKDNQKVSVGKTGIYTITFTYVVGESAPTVSTTKTGDAEATKHTYGVCGWGGDWNNDIAMTENAEGTWTAVITGVAANDYSFKVRADGAWNISYPSSDYLLTVDKDNTTVTIVFVESTKEVTVTQTVVPTAINRVNAEIENAPAYNLAGMKAKKGLVIKNNKKYILR